MWGLINVQFPGLPSKDRLGSPCLCGWVDTCAAQQPPHPFASAAKMYDAVLREAAELLRPVV